jgi:hypothetical protein
MTAGIHCGFPLPISRSFWPTTVDISTLKQPAGDYRIGRRPSRADVTLAWSADRSTTPVGLACGCLSGSCHRMR